MTILDLELNLPDQVTLEAQRAGLLSDQAIGHLIEEEIAGEAATVRAARKATGAAGHSPMWWCRGFCGSAIPSHGTVTKN